MADPQAALATQLKNIEIRTGQSLAHMRALIATSGLTKHGEIRSWLMDKLALGYGDANTVVTLAKQAPAAAEADPLDGIYAGNKAALRALHEQLTAVVDSFGPYEKAPKKANVSLRRKKQFALIGPATKDLLELGLNHKDLPAHPRLKVMPAGGMCQYTVRLGSAAEVDADLQRWLRAAYDAAG
ncbi:MAG: DUF4287 domain-containing protein [Rubrivivax sp.]|nr:DUF4287 domain-containing protein [Rubrivivax sp.]